MKKAFAWFEGNKIEYQLHDYKKLGAPAERVKAWIKQAGWEKVLNTKGQVIARHEGRIAPEAWDDVAEALP